MTQPDSSEAATTSPNKNNSDLKLSKTHKPMPKKESWLQQNASGIILLIAVLLAYGGGRYIRIWIHEWVDNALRDLFPAKDGQAPRIWTVTPNSDDLKVDSAMMNQFLGSFTTMLEKRPPPMEKSSRACVYLFLQDTPKTPNADVHKDWTRLVKKPPCRILAMANTEQAALDSILDLPQLELILCKTRQCVSWVQSKQSKEPKISILYTGFTSSRIPTIPETLTDPLPSDEERFAKFLHISTPGQMEETTIILQAWSNNPDWPMLTLYNNHTEDIVPPILEALDATELPPNVQQYATTNKKKLPSQEDLDTLLYTHGVHLSLSGLSTLNQARAVGALVVTTNQAPMSEVIQPETGFLLETGEALERAMKETILPMSVAERKQLGEQAQKAFAKDRANFKKRMEQLQCYLEKCDADREKQATCAEANCGLTLE